MRLKAQTYLLDDLYKNLDTLHGKMQVLLAFSGIMLAAAAVLVPDKGFTLTPIVAAIVVPAVVAAAFGLFVIDVRWTSATRMASRTLEQACVQYYITRQRRTKFYHAGRLLMLLSTIAYALHFLWR